MRLADFEGRWTLERVVRDHLSGNVARFAGTAELTPDGAGLAYRESGIWTDAPWGPLKAERRYLWRDGGAGRIAVLFEDGRPFHDFGAATEADHWCDPDDYRVMYAFDLPQGWTARWQVEGPRKSYISDTRYLRD